MTADPSLTTCWTVIRAAAAGAPGERDEFARRYGEPLRAYFAARWRGGPREQEVDDAVQEVFVECFRPGGALARVDAARATGGFRAFLYGVARNVARRQEERSDRSARGQPGGRAGVASVQLESLPADDPTLSRAFDRAWALALLREAAARQAANAAKSGPAAQRRVELLRRRFGDEVAIRELAREWGVDAAALHHDYAVARREFLESLRETVQFHEPGATPGDVARQCQELARLLAG